MKKSLALFSLSLSGILLANPPCEPPPYPFGFSAMSLSVKGAEFKERDLATQKLKYSQSNAALSFTHPWNPYWGLIFGGGWVGTEVDWKENPYFNEKHFSYVNLTLGAYTKAMPCWTWTMTAGMFVDTSVLDLKDYTLYQGVLYGKYELTPCLLFDAGFLLEAGLNKAKIWPVLGFEYDPGGRWSLSAVYPLDVSFEYDVTCWLTTGASLRFLRDRHRLADTDLIAMGVYEYTDIGGEFDLTISPWENFALTGFVGATFPGDLKITDRSNHHAIHLKFKGACYGGGSLVWAF